MSCRATGRSFSKLFNININRSLFENVMNDLFDECCVLGYVCTHCARTTHSRGLVKLVLFTLWFNIKNVMSYNMKKEGNELQHEGLEQNTLLSHQVVAQAPKAYIYKVSNQMKYRIPFSAFHGRFF
ncbi:hypothetical protein L6452_08963 [Arctium lappa]|uniref:Uncharacterized protein n=1 Tax=Arctium lappa TaxID=4217 RepID=A0ACB9DIN8_ARCLA|nr:hypothetical protein L6452_08963 [Arctium lappa]